MIAPYLATFFAAKYGDWKILLLVFGGVSLLSFVWLHFSKIEETVSNEKKATIGSCLKLFSVPYIALMVVGIFFVVGIDVGINAASGQFLMVKLNMASEPATQGRSLYFFGKMLGTFLGALLLTRIPAKRFLLWSSITTLLTIVFFIFSPTPMVALSLMFAIGLTASNIFPLIFSITVDKFKERSNEIAGLMVMAVSGGAFIPPIIGSISDIFGVIGGMFVLVVCAVYLLLLSFKTLKN